MQAFDEEATVVDDSERGDAELDVGELEGDPVAPSTAGFRLTGKNLFLTYPDCPLEKEWASECLLGILGPEVVQYMRIGREPHADGRPHLHVFISLIKRGNFKDSRKFDLRAADGTVYHGNYQCTRSAKSVLKYVSKGGDVLNWGELPATLMDEMDRKAQLEAIAAIPTESQLYAYIYANGLDRSYNALSRYWHSLQGTMTTSCSFGLESFRPPMELLANLNGLSESVKALVVVGSSGIGKSQYLIARFASSALRVTHMDDLGKFNAKVHSLILFDDMEFGHYPRASLLHLFDIPTDRSIHIRYRTARIPSMTQIVVVCNSTALCFGVHDGDTALMRRLHIIQLPDHKFY